MAARARKVKEATGDKKYVPSKDIAEDLPAGIDTLVLVPPRNGGPSVPGKRSNKVAPVAPHDPTVSSSSESACRRLIRRAFAPNEFSSLIETILLSKDEDIAIRNLPLEDAQKFVDAIDEALNTPDLPPSAQKMSLKLLYKTCGHHAIVPSALKVQVDYDQTSDAPYRGGHADVWKGRHSGRDVAVKVIRLYSKDVLQTVINRFCKEAVTWRSLRHPNILPLIGVMMSETRFAMVSGWMANGNINEFIKAHPKVDRLELLVDTAEGLIYLHSKGMIHGDVKGLNILIDETYHARLADFGLLTIMSDPAHFIASSSFKQGGTIRWMSPELIVPEKFQLPKSRLTISSDCYALAMVIYETISGNMPFHECAEPAVYAKVMLGQHPSRGAVFSDDLWKMMEMCWTSRPDDRPSIADVLRCLRATSDSLEPIPKPGGRVEIGGGNQTLSDGSLIAQIGPSRTNSAKRKTHKPSQGRAADNGLSPASTPSQPPITKSAGDGGYLILPSPNFSISSLNSDEGGGDQDLRTNVANYYSSPQSHAPPSLHMHPLFAYSHLHHAPIQYNVSRTPSAQTVTDSTTHSPVPVDTLAQPATDPPTTAPDQLLLRSHKFPWTIVVKSTPQHKKTECYGWHFPVTWDVITNFDVLHAIHTTLNTQVTPEEWGALGNESKAQKRVARAYDKRCSAQMGGWEQGVRRVDWLGSKIHLVGIEVDSGGGGSIGKLVFARISRGSPTQVIPSLS